MQNNFANYFNAASGVAVALYWTHYYMDNLWKFKFHAFACLI